MNVFEFMSSEYANWGVRWYVLGTLVVFFLIGLLVYLAYSKTELTVTDKRIYGTASFGKKVDLPIDTISSIGSGVFRAISVASSSGKISFCAIKNRDEIHKAISDLLISRQNKPLAGENNKGSNADELKKYKELLDSGVISQEEFETKKKQLLG